MKRKVWIVSFYTTSPQYDTHLRHQRFSEYLAEKDYEVTILSGSMMHGTSVELIQDGSSYKECSYEGKKYIHFKTIHYTSNGLIRMFAIFQFAWKVYRYRNRFEKPDIILHNLHVPFDLLIGRVARKLKAVYLAEVWDLWPESFVSFGLVGPRNLLLKWAYRQEKRAYQRASEIIFTMEGGADYIREKGWERLKKNPIDLSKVHYINNGVDLRKFESDKLQYASQDPDLLDDSVKRIVYMGSIRLANGLKQVLDAAIHLKSRPEVKILIYGNGSEREALEEYVRTKEISNVIFKEKWVPLEQVPFILSCAYLNLLIYKPNDIERFGSSSGKMFQYMASGKPICSNSEAGYSPIAAYHLGIARNFKSDREFAEALLSLIDMNRADYHNMCDRAVKVAESFDYRVLADRLIQVLDKV